MRKTLLLLLVCLAIFACTDPSRQLLGSWYMIDHYEHDSTKFPYIKYLEGITVYEFHPDNRFHERHYIEVLRGNNIERTHDQLRYTGTWHHSGDTLVIHKTIKELRPYYGDMDTTDIDESDLFLIQSLTRDSLLVKEKLYRTFLDLQLHRVR